MRHPAYTIEQYRSERRAQALDVHSYLWDPDRSVNAASFSWKYERNPIASEPIVFTALCDGVVVGMRGFGATSGVTGFNASPLIKALDDYDKEPVVDDR